MTPLAKKRNRGRDLRQRLAQLHREMETTNQAFGSKVVTLTDGARVKLTTRVGKWARATVLFEPEEESVVVYVLLLIPSSSDAQYGYDADDVPLTSHTSASRFIEVSEGGTVTKGSDLAPTGWTGYVDGGFWLGPAGERISWGRSLSTPVEFVHEGIFDGTTKIFSFAGFIAAGKNADGYVGVKAQHLQLLGQDEILESYEVTGYEIHQAAVSQSGGKAVLLATDTDGTWKVREADVSSWPPVIVEISSESMEATYSETPLTVGDRRVWTGSRRRPIQVWYEGDVLRVAEMEVLYSGDVSSSQHWGDREFLVACTWNNGSDDLRYGYIKDAGDSTRAAGSQTAQVDIYMNGDRKFTRTFLNDQKIGIKEVFTNVGSTFYESDDNAGADPPVYIGDSCISAAEADDRFPPSNCSHIFWVCSDENWEAPGDIVRTFTQTALRILPDKCRDDVIPVFDLGTMRQDIRLNGVQDSLAGYPSYTYDYDAEATFVHSDGAVSGANCTWNYFTPTQFPVSRYSLNLLPDSVGDVESTLKGFEDDLLTPLSTISAVGGRRASGNVVASARIDPPRSGSTDGAMNYLPGLTIDFPSGSTLAGPLVHGFVETIKGA